MTYAILMLAILAVGMATFAVLKARTPAPVAPAAPSFDISKLVGLLALL